MAPMGEKGYQQYAWILPIFLVNQLVNSQGGLGWQADLVSLIFVLAGLFILYRKFHPKGQA